MALNVLGIRRFAVADKGLRSKDQGWQNVVEQNTTKGD
jgi:hypothetical protein